jgi:hypothetical protein
MYLTLSMCAGEAVDVRVGDAGLCSASPVDV